MFDFSFIDPMLMFPDIPAGWALTIDSIWLLLSFASVILVVLAEWKLFKKFGEKSWKSLVPYYSIYIMYKHGWSKKPFWIFFVSDALFDVCNIISSHLADNAPESAWMTLLTLFSVPLGIIAAVCSVLYALRLAEAFGKGKIFGVGLFLVYSVFVSIIGFGKSKYIEIRENDADEAAAEDSQDIGVVV